VSFILDALRKSEHDRQRTAGPALAEVPVAPAKPRTNLWAPIAVALLVVNVAVIGVLLLRKSNDVAATTAPPAAAASVASPAPTAAPPVVRPAPAPVPGGLGAQNPLADEAGGGQPGVDPELLAGAAAVPEGPPAVTSTGTGRGSVVYESLPDSAVVGGPPAVAAMPPPRPAEGTGTPSGSSMPSADELAGAGVPQLNLDLHVYTTRPAERLVFINSHKYREGDTLAEGPVVQQITPRGVVLEYGGRSYLLAQQ